MDIALARRNGRVGALRRMVAGTPSVAGTLLAVLAAFEAATKAADNNVSGQFPVMLSLVAVATALPLALLRPGGAAVAISTATVLSAVFFHSLTVAGLVAQLIALYRLGRYESRSLRAQAPAVGVATSFLVLALAGPRPLRSEAATLTVLLAALGPAAALVGIARQGIDEARRQGQAREYVDGALLEHTARGERARIARELHDVVAHHISMVAVQAETARLTTPGMPAAGAQRLSAIGDTARAALTEMRRLLGVLREDVGFDAAEREPQPGLRQLNDLLDEARDASGTATRLILSGRPVPLDAGVELAAYRIAQEALTNARRHAPGAAVDVELHFTADTLRIRIRDNGPGAPPSTTLGGHGLLGMRERATAVGGQLLAGPAAGGGFLVEATLPATAEALT
ncbi:MAG: sensor histidine kinase [Actinomycetota bacterium]